MYQGQGPGWPEERRRGRSRRRKRRRSLRPERLVALIQKHGDAVVALIGADDVGQAVLVEIPHHHLRRIGKQPQGDVLLGGEAAVALTEQNGDVAVGLVSDRQIEEAIEVEVAGGDRPRRSGVAAVRPATLWRA